MPTLLLVGTKSDLTHLREVSSAQVQLLAARLGCAYLECSSSASRQSVDSVLETLLSNHSKKTGGVTKKPTALRHFKQQLKNLTDFRSRTNTF